MIRQLFSTVEFTAIVETGTYRGNSTYFFRRISKAPIWTVERDTRYFTYSRLRFLPFRRVRVRRGDSRVFLERLASSPFFPKARVFFYLDAHWGTDLPLHEEVATITGNWTESVILIDDFQVPDDEGYGFDEYGEGKRLSRDYLSGLDLTDFVELYPACPSERETGSKRGSVLLLAKQFEEHLPKLTDFRTIPIHNPSPALSPSSHPRS